MPEDFSKNKIKDYAYWSLFVHPNQSYLGRCVVWCNRSNAHELTDATIEERDELFLILKELRAALDKSFSPDMLNFAFLGNITYHLHGHVIPRYKDAREFAGVRFADKRWGRNYRTDESFETPPEALDQIKREIQSVLNSVEKE